MKGGFAMLLVDKEIKQRGKDIVIEGYDENNVNSVSYDVTLECIITNDAEKESYILQPGETIFVRTKEMIHMPDDLMGRIGEKNSKMRLGIQVSGPHYFPGHKTYMFLRVSNISPNRIKLDKGDKIAQIFFEQLKEVPQKTYNLQENASFNNEEKYRGFAGYQDEYERKILKIEQQKEELEEKESKIYANIMTIMGVFVAVFSMIMVNFTNINAETANLKFLVMLNLSLGIVVVLFVGLMLIFLNKAKSKNFLVAYIIFMLILVIALLVLAGVGGF